ncbi:MAG: hypothetical protein C0391_02795 [Anaerolinea sp.]|nr:hypothetical protein [Anaerolinea sp.]
MKQSTFKLLMVALLIGIITVACGFSASTANISSAVMSADDTGSQQTSVFSQDATFYAIIELKNAPDDTTVKAVWTAVDVVDTEKGLVIDEFSMTSGDATIPFSLSNDNLWPTGKYKVDIYLNDELNKTLEFEVQ